MDDRELCFLRAAELVALMRRKELSAREVMAAHLAQIARVNPTVNAIVTLLPERALAGALAADDALARGGAPGPLHGLPIAHKDLALTKGIRTTFGSPIYADFVPDEDALVVERTRAAGAITIGKTNTPEFGAGSQTFNPVFGATLNPWDTAKTCGGSSGGAAVALATGMIPIADGSDLGGSLRNPANFNNVVGFRTSQGRVPVWPSEMPWSSMSVEGPMARTVDDVALLLSAIAGPDGRVPVSLGDPGASFFPVAERDFRGVRVAWSKDLGGLPVDPAVAAVLQGQRRTFEALGCIVEEADPDLAGADEAFETFRAMAMATRFGPLLESDRARLKETVIWNIEEGLRLSGVDVGRAEANKLAVWQRMRQFMERYELLVCPVNQVPPFDITRQYPSEVAGVPMRSYIEWMRTCSRITVTGHPALALPAGFTPDGLPVGLQIVGRWRDETGVLQLGKAFEAATGLWKRRPPIAT
ncbi:MAG: amidase [Dehalococcoidia bacterium]